ASKCDQSHKDGEKIMGTAITPHTQHKRLLRLMTPLGEDVLIPTAVSGSETLSAGFTYTLHCFSESRFDLEATELVGKAVSCSLVQADTSYRYFNGLVTRLSDLGRGHAGQRAVYELTLQPWLHLLDNHSDCRIFQQQS